MEIVSSIRINENLNCFQRFDPTLASFLKKKKKVGYCGSCCPPPAKNKKNKLTNTPQNVPHLTRYLRQLSNQVNLYMVWEIFQKFN